MYQYALTSQGIGTGTPFVVGRLLFNLNPPLRSSSPIYSAIYRGQKQFHNPIILKNKINGILYSSHLILPHLVEIPTQNLLINITQTLACLSI